MSPRMRAPSEGLDLRELTKDWFLFLSSFRRQAAGLESDPHWVRSKLEDLLSDMEHRARTDARLEVVFNDVKPILIYLADEIVLTSGWAGEMSWAEDLLETAHFGTQHAGDDFFDRLDQALAADKPEVLEIYFKALCLGFKGRLLKRQEQLEKLRRDLYRRLPTERVTEARFYPQAYGATDERHFVKLPVVAVARIAIGLIVFLIVIYLVASFTFEDRLEDLDTTATEYLKRPLDDR